MQTVTESDRTRALPRGDLDPDTLTGVGGEVPVALASVGRRFLAWAVDLLALAAFVILLGAVLDPSETNDTVTDVLLLASLALVPTYFAIFEGSSRGQTLGKWSFGIAVRKRDTLGRLSYRRAALRAYSRLLCWLLFFLAVPLWDALAAVHDKNSRQTWHDIAAGSVVVRLAAVPAPRLEQPSLTYRTLRTLLVAGWVATAAVILFFEPEPDMQAATPPWAWLVYAPFLVALVGAAVAGGRGRTRFAYRASFAAALLGIPAAYLCGATAHHSTAWWGFELTAHSSLALLSALALLATKPRG